MKKIVIFALTVFLVNFIFAETVTVKQDGTGDFEDIFEAVLYLQTNDGGTIVVYPGIYWGFIADFYDVEINIIGTNKEECILESNSFIVDIRNQDGILTIRNLTIRNAGFYGIKIWDDSDGYTLIENNIISGCGYEPQMNQNASAICCYGNAIIKNNQIINNTNHWWDYQDFDYSLGGAIYVNYHEESSDGYIEIIENDIINNFAADAGAVYCTTNQYLLFEDNYLEGNCLVEASYMPENNSPGWCCVATFENCSEIDFLNNIFYRNFYFNYLGMNPQDCKGIHFLDCEDVEIINNTIDQDLSDIEDGGLEGITIGYNNEGNNFSIVNNIVVNNRWGIVNECNELEPMYVDYNLVYNNPPIYDGAYNYHDVIPGPTCMNVDPQLADPENGDFSLKWTANEKSPCIDTGDPYILDCDTTPSDMGAIPAYSHDYHFTQAETNKVRYRSLPVLDRIYNEGFNTEYVFESVPEQTSYFVIYDQDGNEKEWQDDSWDGYLNTLDSVIGYKVETESDIVIPTSGITLPETTLIDLNAGENWIGYFVKESMTINDAFAGIWDHLLAIYGEDWAWKNDGTFPSERSTLVYGKMYIVKVDEACNFVYGEGEPVTPKEREMTEGFNYSETPEYTPINILSLDDPAVEEIAVMIDDQCIGATKVEEFPLQILAFNDYGRNGNISFEFFYGNRTYQKAKEYSVYEDDTNGFTGLNLELKPYEFQTIRFGAVDEIPITFELLSNYPNPFQVNGIGTTINYSIPSDINVELSIYNIKGQNVTTLVNGSQDAGSYSTVWNGKDKNNKFVASGIYLYKLTAGKETSIKRMLLMK